MSYRRKNAVVPFGYDKWPAWVWIILLLVFVNIFY